jgi:hypothetical protein
MRRLCTESSCSYSGRSVSLAVRAAREVELRTSRKRLESPSNPTVAVVAMGAGLRASAKALEPPTGPYRDSGSASCGNAWRDEAEVSRGHSSQTPAVMGGTR